MGNPVIDTLLAQHREMREVLGFVTAQLDMIARNEQPDLMLLNEALRYMRRFAGLVHHPVEERVCERLLELRPALQPEVGRLSDQHRRIYELEAWLAEAVQQAAREGAAAFPRLLDFGRTYLLVQKQHSEMEEDCIFPHALAVLRAGDWRLLRRRIKALSDPRLQEIAAHCLRVLRRHPRGAAA
ncbi:MAG TPA: hemerythrin domain-containing protein [Gammaproteobacteria bacterium]|nr:hemerythrin domain-containing protein [Gammaproteobacteria bacterium]